jgi:hypothetical protein
VGNINQIPIPKKATVRNSLQTDSKVSLANIRIQSSKKESMIEKRKKDWYTEIKQPLTASLVKNLIIKIQKKPEVLARDASRKSLEHF